MFAAVTHFVEDITDVIGEKFYNLLSGYREPNIIHNKATVSYVIEIVNKKRSVNILSPRI
jgi:hypothetical protein